MNRRSGRLRLSLRSREKKTTPSRVSPRKAKQQQQQHVDVEEREAEVAPRKIARRSPIKKGKLSESTPVPGTGASLSTGGLGYSSDGMSFESLPDDDDTLPDIDTGITSPFKGKKYVKGDIVWAPNNNLYWPALVTSVKWPKVCFVLINNSDLVYRSSAIRLISFENPTKNLELKEIGEKTNTKMFVPAYELVVNYLCKRKECSDIDARRFLTLSDNNDQVRRAKDCLFRLTGVSDTQPPGVNVNDSSDNEDCVDVDLNDDDDDDDDDDESSNEESGFIVSRQSAEEKAKVKQILRDLETLPTHMTVTPKESEEMRKEAEQLLGFIQSKECFEHLMKIRNGSEPSSRHTKFYKSEVVRTGLGPFTLFSDLTSKFLTTLDEYCDDHDLPKYKHDVMLPEAIIYAIMQAQDCNKLSAKKRFNLLCNKVGVSD